MLSDASVAEFLGQHYVCCFQQLAEYAEGKGNTAAYFLTPERKVLNILAGAINNPTRFIQAASRARYLATTQPVLAKIFYESMADETGNTLRRRTASLLAAAPFPDVESIYWIVFSELLGESMDYDMRTKRPARRAWGWLQR